MLNINPKLAFFRVLNFFIFANVFNAWMMFMKRGEPIAAVFYLIGVITWGIMTFGNKENVVWAWVATRNFFIRLGFVVVMPFAAIFGIIITMNVQENLWKTLFNGMYETAFRGEVVFDKWYKPNIKF